MVVRRGGDGQHIYWLHLKEDGTAWALGASWSHVDLPQSLRLPLSSDDLGLTSRAKVDKLQLKAVVSLLSSVCGASQTSQKLHTAAPPVSCLGESGEGLAASEDTRDGFIFTHAYGQENTSVLVIFAEILLGLTLIFRFAPPCVLRDGEKINQHHLILRGGDIPHTSLSQLTLAAWCIMYVHWDINILRRHYAFGCVHYLCAYIRMYHFASVHGDGGRMGWCLCCCNSCSQQPKTHACAKKQQLLKVLITLKNERCFPKSQHRHGLTFPAPFILWRQGKAGLV